MAQRKYKSWGDVGRDDAAKCVYRPPESFQARQAYQWAWEQVASDAAWYVRMTGEQDARDGIE